MRHAEGLLGTGRAALRVAWMAGLLAVTPVSHAQTAAPARTVPDEVAEALRFGDLPELERLYATYGQPGVRSPLTGADRISHFWMGVSTVADSNLRVEEGYFTQLDAMTRQWAQDHPQSVVAQLLHADSLRRHAWYLRGSGYANTVPATAWAGFEKYLQQSFEQLRRNEALLAKESSWNLLLIQVGRGLGWRIDQLMPVFENGIARNPDHDELYFSMFTSLMPRWGGDLDTAERFIARVEQATRERRGLELYTRLYAVLSYEEVKQSLFRSTRASWPKMKAGFEERLKRYPHNDHRNVFAYFACMAQDRESLQEQLRLLDGAYDRASWGSTPDRTYDECKALARQL